MAQSSALVDDNSIVRSGIGEVLMGLLDYFNRLAIIHLPDRDDRLRALIEDSHDRV